jgi:hypothetical protein
VFYVLLVVSRALCPFCAISSVACSLCFLCSLCRVNNTQKLKIQHTQADMSEHWTSSGEKRRLDRVCEMQRQGVVLDGAMDRVRRIQELGTARWRTVPDSDTSIVVHSCNVCGYKFGAQRTSCSSMATIIAKLVSEHKTMHDEVCRSGLFTCI